MRYFTESPFERLMMEKPSGHPVAAYGPVMAGCEGCAYGGKKPCIAVCMRKLTGLKEMPRHGEAHKENGQIQPGAGL